METSAERKFRKGVISIFIVFGFIIFFLFGFFISRSHSASLIPIHIGDIGNYSIFYFDYQYNASTTNTCYYSLDINNHLYPGGCLRN